MGNDENIETINLTKSQFDEIAFLLKKDAEDIASQPEFFSECGYNPNQYIDERIALCTIFNVDFWHTIDLGCNHFVYHRLKALYDGQSLEDFTNNYVKPSENELMKDFEKALFRKNENH
jgi:hypothetical protein